MIKDHDVPEENRFTDWKEALNKTKFADAPLSLVYPTIYIIILV